MTSLLPFRWHIAEVLLIVAAGVAHHIVVTSKRERQLALYALLALLIVTVWPGTEGAAAGLSSRNSQGRLEGSSVSV